MVVVVLVTPYLAAFALVLFESFGVLRKRGLRIPRLHPGWWVALEVFTYAAQLAVLRYAAFHGEPPAAWRVALPIPVIYFWTAHEGVLSAAFLALGTLQSIGLVALYRAVVPRAWLLSGAVVLIAMSVLAPVLSSFDLYGYVQNGLLGRAAYAPPNVALPGEYHAIDLWFHGPGVTLYGPLWIPIVQMVTGLGTTLLAKLLALRAFSMCLWLALLVCLRALRFSRSVLVVTALNPALLLQFVANGHNDLIAIVLLTLGAFFASVYPAIAFALVALVGAFKLPYVVLGLPILAGVRPAWLRFVGIAVAVVGALAISWFGAGLPYVRVLAAHSGSFDAQTPVYAIAFAGGLAAIAVAVLGGPRLRGSVWLLPAFGAFRQPFVLPWYCIFGFPYALARRSLMRYLLVCFPFVTALLLPEFRQVWTQYLVVPCVVVLSLGLVTRTRRGTVRRTGEAE